MSMMIYSILFIMKSWAINYSRLALWDFFLVSFQENS